MSNTETSSARTVVTATAGTESQTPRRDGFKLSYALWGFFLLLYIEAIMGLSLAYDFYLSGVLLWILPTLISIIAWPVLIVLNLVKRRWRRALSLFVAPFLGVALISMLGYLGLNKDEVRFEYRKSGLLKDVAESAATHGHPVLINWGWGEMGGGFGSATIEIDLVYDETDQIALPPSTWSAAFRSRLFDQPPREPGKDYNQGGGQFPPNDYTSEPSVDKMGDHFYLVSQTFG